MSCGSLRTRTLLQINKTPVNGRLQTLPKVMHTRGQGATQQKGRGPWAGRRSQGMVRHAPDKSRYCLPRLNKTCLNSSKWRESLGIRALPQLTGKEGMDAEAHQVTEDRD